MDNSTGYFGIPEEVWTQQNNSHKPSIFVSRFHKHVVVESLNSNTSPHSMKMWENCIQKKQWCCFELSNHQFQIFDSGLGRVLDSNLAHQPMIHSIWSPLFALLVPGNPLQYLHYSWTLLWEYHPRTTYI